MIVYKLFRKRKDGTLGPLFIGRSQIIPLNVWLEAEDIPTKGYARRPGWHSGPLPYAPHLSSKGRVWCECEVGGIQLETRTPQELKERSQVIPKAGWYYLDRPAAQGGRWVVSGHLRVNRVLSKFEVRTILRKRHAKAQEAD